MLNTNWFANVYNIKHTHILIYKIFGQEISTIYIFTFHFNVFERQIYVTEIISMPLNLKYLANIQLRVYAV